MGRAVTINGRRVILSTDAPTADDIRTEGHIPGERMLVDATRGSIVGPLDRPEGDEFYDAPRFNKGGALWGRAILT